MEKSFSIVMREAAQLTRAHKIVEATRLIQRALSGGVQNSAPDEELPQALLPIAPTRNDFRPPRHAAQLKRIAAENAGSREVVAPEPATQARRPLGEIVSLLAKAGLRSRAFGPRSLRAKPVPPVSEGAAFLTRTFTCQAGAREYKVYVPAHGSGRKRALIVMLHGCTQDPDDFAIGTGMNLLAEQHDFIVAYPRQSTSANPSACWNWFNPVHQARDGGEPMIIAGITRQLMAEFDIDAARVFVAGLSAGGAMAAIMGAVYPDLYAAVGVHSGLAYGSARDVPTAFAAMRRPSGLASVAKATPPSDPDRGVRTIVFHGTADPTVHCSNSNVILAEAIAGISGAASKTIQGSAAGEHAYARTVIFDAAATPHAEHWAIEGMAHAWSGGNIEGSFTDPSGPDASREMLRFFWYPVDLESKQFE